MHISYFVRGNKEENNVQSADKNGAKAIPSAEYLLSEKMTWSEPKCMAQLYSEQSHSLF